MPGARKALPQIDPARCTGCGWCVAACPPAVLSLAPTGQRGVGSKQSVLHGAAGCTGCALCEVRCPFSAIQMVRRPPPQTRP